MSFFVSKGGRPSAVSNRETAARYTDFAGAVSIVIAAFSSDYAGDRGGFAGGYNFYAKTRRIIQSSLHHAEIPLHAGRRPAGRGH